MDPIGSAASGRVEMNVLSANGRVESLCREARSNCDHTDRQTLISVRCASAIQPPTACPLWSCAAPALYRTDTSFLSSMVETCAAAVGTARIPTHRAADTLASRHLGS